MPNKKREMRPHNTEAQVDFFVIIDYKRLRGVKIVRMDDGDGDFDECLLIPTLKNGIKSWGKSKFRVILSAIRSKREENASHVLLPLVEDATQRAMAARGYFDRYEYSAPIIGDVVPDITKIPCPPVYGAGTPADRHMQEHVTDNPAGGLTAVNPSLTKEEDTANNGNIERKYLTGAQARLREILLKRKGGT